MGSHTIEPESESIAPDETNASRQTESELRKAYSDLQRRAAERTNALMLANQQLKQEIRDRERVEKALRESEERYRALFENNPIGTIIVDHEARVVGYNLARVETGSRIPKIGDVMYRDYAGKHANDMLSELKECIRSGIAKEFPDQQYGNRFLHIRISPFSGGAIITSLDITYRKRVEEALRESEKRYRSLVETIPHGIQEIDTTGTITYANSALAQLYAYPEHELIGRNVLDLLSSDTDRAEMRAFLQKLVETEPQPAPYLNECITKTGRYINIQTDWNYKRNKQGKITGFIAIITNITKRLRAEKDKEKLEGQLRHAQKMEAIGTLAGGIAHDFNNILGSILLNTELALEDLSDNPDAAYSLEQVIKGSHRAKDLIEQILTFSREAEAERKPLKINTIIKETLKMLRAMLPSTIQIRQEIAEDINPVLADPAQIQQLVMNLCNNAAQAIEPKGGTITVECKNIVLETPPPDSDLAPGPYVRIAVNDGGCGIGTEIKDRIFDPFFTTKRPGEGTGLGLSVVHGIVIHHEGNIVFNSDPGEGSRFEIFIPVIEDKLAAVHYDVLGEAPPTGNEHILFVDDEEVVVDANSRILERLGYRVTTAADGHEALRIFQREPEAIDLLITDMTMPNMTGEELAREAIRVKPDLPVILCTGYSQFMTPEKAKTCGIQAFLTKPFGRLEIAEAIRNVLDQS